MGRSKYIYTFVPSGEVPSLNLRTGMTRSVCVQNAKAAASKDGVSQDVYRRALEDAQGHRSVDDSQGWQLVNTIGKKQLSAKTNPEIAEPVVARECIRCIQEVLPNAAALSNSRVMHYRRDGMLEAIQAIKRHFNLS